METFGRFRAGSGDPRTALRPFALPVTAGFIPVERMILHYPVLNSPTFPSAYGGLDSVERMILHYTRLLANTADVYLSPEKLDSIATSFSPCGVRHLEGRRVERSDIVLTRRLAGAGI